MESTISLSTRLLLVSYIWHYLKKIVGRWIVSIGLIMKYIVLIILLKPFVVFSFDIGNELKEICGTRLDASLELACQAYIKGVIEGVSLGGKVASFDITGEYVNYQIFCLPDDGVIDQYVAVVKMYMDENPELLNESSSSFVTLAIREAYPCK